MKNITFNRLLPRYAYAGQFLLENLLPIPHSGVTVGSNLTWDFSGGSLTLPTSVTLTTPTIVGAVTFPSTLTATGAVTPTGGVAAAGGFAVPTSFSTGNRAAISTTGYTSTQIVTTDTYFAEIFIPANTSITGVAILNGHTTNAGVNLTVGLANSAGTIVAKSATTATQSTADTYQQIPFTTPYPAVGPAKYYVAVQGSTTTGYIYMHAVGNFGALLKTSETYGTFVTTASYSTTTFTTNQGPVADTY